MIDLKNLDIEFLSDREIELKIEKMDLIDDSGFLFELIWEAQNKGISHSDQYLIDAYNEFYEIE